MYNSQPIAYTIQPGDTPYKLAKTYGISVSQILAMNPNMNPNNLQIGTTIFIPYNTNNNYNNRIDNNDTSLMSDMRLVWEQQIYWTRMLLISIAERLNDQSPTMERLLRGPSDIASIFNRYYGSNVASLVQELITEHLQIAADLITALRDNQHNKATELTQQWYQNANKIADAFSSINPYFNKQSIQSMLYRFLDLTIQQINKRLAGDYQGDIMAFDLIELEVLKMADNLTSGIMNQFPQKF
jgi:LysM domain.